MNKAFRVAWLGCASLQEPRRGKGEGWVQREGRGHWETLLL